MARQKKRDVCGITASQDRETSIWTWEVRDRTFRWEGMNRVEEFLPDGGITLLAMVRTIDAAIAFTVGYMQGLHTVVFPMLENGQKEATDNPNVTE